MLLSSEMFDRVVTSLHPGRSGTSAAGGGQRQTPRIPVTTRLTIVPFATGAESLAGFDFPIDRTGSLRIPLADPVSVPVRDLSRGGIRFMTPRRLSLDTPFVLLLPSGYESHSTLASSPTALECTISYWQPIQRDLFAIGAQFIRELKPFRVPTTPVTILLPGFGMPNDLRVAG